MTRKSENIKPMPKGKENKEEAKCLPVHAGNRKTLFTRKSVGVSLINEIVGVVIEDQNCPICSYTYSTITRPLTKKELHEEILKALDK